MIRKFLVAVLVVGCCVISSNDSIVMAEPAPKSVDSWAWCGVHPDDPHAQVAARSMAVFSGIDATFGPCKDGAPGYSPAEPGDRYVSPELYMRVVQINAGHGMQTVVYDKRIWSEDAAVRNTAKAFWRPVYEHLAAWDMGDEYDPDSPEWDILIERMNIVLDDVALDSGVQPYTNHIGPGVEPALAEVPGSETMLSFDFYFGDGGEAIARSVDSQVQTLMCAVNTYDVDSFRPTPASIRDTTNRLIRAGCDMILTFGGTQVYGSAFLGPRSTKFGPMSIIDANGNPTERGTAVLEATGYSSYLPVDPARLLETRVGAGLATVDGQSNGIGRRAPNSITELQVAGRANIGLTAASVVLTITAIDAALPGFVTVYPCGATRPNVAQVNYAPGGPVATTTLVKLSTTGKVCLYNFTDTDLVVDVAGSQPVGTTFVALQPARLLETRSDPSLSTVDGAFAGVGMRGANSVTQLTVAGRAGVPAGAATATLSVTITNAKQPGFATVYPCQTSQPPTASINFPAGTSVTTNAVVSGLATNGLVCLFTSVDADMVVDVGGYSPSGASLVAIAPQRVLDTRNAARPRPAPSSTVFEPVRELQVGGVAGVPIDAKAAVINLTVTQSTAAGHVTVFPCDSQRPNASNINFTAGATTSNMVVAELSHRGTICFFSPADPHYVVDVAAYHP